MLLEQKAEHRICTDSDDKHGITDLTELIIKRKAEMSPKWLNRAYLWVKRVRYIVSTQYHFHRLLDNWVESQIRAVLESFSGFWYYYYECLSETYDFWIAIELTCKETVLFT